MPWKETNVMQLKTEFFIRSMMGSIPFRTLCREYGISAKTGLEARQESLPGETGKPVRLKEGGLTPTEGKRIRLARASPANGGV